VPQFVALAVVSMHAVPHRVWPPAQLELQLPLLQTSLVWQMVVQFPQWVASEATQEPLQSSTPAWHRHWLLWQVRPPEQGMPQPPQFITSAVVSTHSVPQAVCPFKQSFPGPSGPPPGVPGLPLEQAAASTAKPSPKTHTRAVVMTPRFPVRGKLIKGPAYTALTYALT
jgi:hypothetical protein